VAEVVLVVVALTVCVPAMAYSDDVNQALLVRDPIHDTPFAYSNSPKVVCAFEFHDSRGARVRH